MFTKATKNFGIWKQHHHAFHFSRKFIPFQLFFVLMTSLLVTWLVYAIVVNTRISFFYVESFPITLPVIKTEKPSQAYRHSEYALSLLVFPSEKSELRLVFDTANAFLYPRDKKAINEFLARRKFNLLRNALLMRESRSALEKVSIWPDSRVNMTLLQDVVQYLSSVGFEIFDIALENKELK